jgi:hypothetical protein
VVTLFVGIVGILGILVAIGAAWMFDCLLG